MASSISKSVRRLDTSTSSTFACSVIWLFTVLRTARSCTASRVSHTRRLQLYKLSLNQGNFPLVFYGGLFMLKFLNLFSVLMFFCFSSLAFGASAQKEYAAEFAFNHSGGFQNHLLGTKVIR